MQVGRDARARGGPRSLAARRRLGLAGAFDRACDRVEHGTRARTGAAAAVPLGSLRASQARTASRCCVRSTPITSCRHSATSRTEPTLPERARRFLELVAEVLRGGEALVRIARERLHARSSSSGFGTSGRTLLGGGDRLVEDAVQRLGLAVALEEALAWRAPPRARCRTRRRRRADRRSPPRACSGAMYASLPLSCPARVVERRAAARATPKSVMRATPSTPTRMFCGETSRWTICSGSP